MVAAQREAKMSTLLKHLAPILLLLFVCSDSVLAQLVQNYERRSESLPGWQVPNKLDEKTYTVSLDASVRHGGNGSALLWAKESLGTKNESTVFLKQVFKADKFRGLRVRFSLFIKADNVHMAAIWMRMGGENMMTLNDDRMDQSNAIKGTSDWQKYSLVMDVPDRSLDIGFGVTLRDAGQLWVDDVTFEIVSKSTDLTSAQTPEMIETASLAAIEGYKATYRASYEEEIRFRSARLKALPANPVNLDFENRWWQWSR